MTLVAEGLPKGDTAALVSLSCGTDNQGNSFLLDRMLTTKYPLAVVLMELAHQMRMRRLVVRAKWLPRDQNEEADALTNFDFRHFKPENRIEVNLANLGFKVLPELFECGEAYLKDLEAERARQRDLKAKRKGKAFLSRRRGPGLRVTDPWP